MKKTLLFLLIVLISSGTIFAQTKRGNLVLSGGTGLLFSISSQKSVYDGVTEDKTTISSFSFLPSIGYFVIDNLAVGLAGNITTTMYKYDGGSKDVSISAMILPTAVYYIPIDGKIRPLAQIGVGFVTQSSKYIPVSGSEDKSSGSGITFNFGGGIAYFVKENISLNFGLSYTIARLTDGDDDKSKLKEGNFAGNLGFSIFF